VPGYLIEKALPSVLTAGPFYLLILVYCSHEDQAATASQGTDDGYSTHSRQVAFFQGMAWT
jgi:hypothetical protein